MERRLNALGLCSATLPWRVVALMLVLLAACTPEVTSREFAEKTTGGSAPPLVAPPDTGAIEYSGDQPDQPSDEIAKGLLSQTVFDTARDEAAAPAAAAPARAPRYQVEARNLLVGPGQRTAATTLPGGAVFEVRSGAGTVTVADKTQDITTGATFAVSEGESFSFASGADMELALRVYVIRLR